MGWDGQESYGGRYKAAAAAAESVPSEGGISAGAVGCLGWTGGNYSLKMPLAKAVAVVWRPLGRKTIC